MQNIGPIIITSHDLLSQHPVISVHNNTDQQINENNYQQEGTDQHEDGVRGGQRGVYVRFQEVVYIQDEHCVDFCEEEEKGRRFVVDYVEQVACLFKENYHK